MRKKHAIQAIDGAGPEGTTLYVLYDPEGYIVGTSTWPYPLEAQAGGDYVRLPSIDGREADLTDADNDPLSRTAAYAW